MTIVLGIIAVLFTVGACCSIVALERNGRLALVRRAPFENHPLRIRFRLLSHPAMVPLILIYLAWSGFLAVVTLGFTIICLVIYISKVNRELEQIAEVYWGHENMSSSQRSHDVSNDPPADADDCSPAEAIASDASTLAGTALQNEGMSRSDRFTTEGLVTYAERMEYCSSMLYMKCVSLAERGYNDATLIAKTAIGEMITMLDREVEQGNTRAAHALQACRRAFSRIGDRSMAA